MAVTVPTRHETQLRRRTLGVAAFGTLLALVTFTAPLAALPSTAAGLGAGPAGQTWILSSMSLGLAAALLTAGALGDDHGRRRVLVGGAGLLAGASLVAALAGDTLVFVLARIAEGVGAAAVIACSLGVIGHAFPAGPARTGATGAWGAAVGGGIAAGPLLAALLDPVGFHATYGVIAVAALLLAAAGRAWLVESRAEVPRRVDVPGMVLLAGGLAALLAGLVEGRSGWGQASTVVLLVIGVLGLLVFVAVERSSRGPMLDLALFRNPPFVGATAGAFATGMGVIATMSLLSTVVARGLGEHLIVAALCLLTWSGVSVPVALLARRLPARFAPELQMAAGLFVVAAGQLALVGISARSGLPRLLPGLVVAGLGSGVLNAALGRQAIASVPADRGAVGSGANNTARYVGSAIGTTVVVVIATRPALGTGAAALVDGWNQAVPVSAACSIAGALVVLAARRVGLRR